MKKLKHTQKITENTNHAPLEGTRGIAQAERHPPIGKSVEGAGECGLFLILKSNSDLHITRKTIEETVVRFTCQVFKHLVNEWQGKMVPFGNLVQPPIADADSPTVLHLSRNHLLLLIFYHGEAGFLRNYLDGTHPLAFGDRINDSNLQKLGYLLLHYIKNYQVESSLWLSYWFSPIF